MIEDVRLEKASLIYQDKVDVAADRVWRVSRRHVLAIHGICVCISRLVMFYMYCYQLWCTRSDPRPTASGSQSLGLGLIISPLLTVFWGQLEAGPRLVGLRLGSKRIYAIENKRTL